MSRKTSKALFDKYVQTVEEANGRYFNKTEWRLLWHYWKFLVEPQLHSEHTITEGSAVK